MGNGEDGRSNGLISAALTLAVQPAIAAILGLLRRTSLLPHFRNPQPGSIRYIRSLWLSLSIGLASVLALAPSYDATTLACAGLSLFASVGLYGSLIHMSETSNELLAQPIQPRRRSAIRVMAARTVALLLAAVILLPFVLVPGKVLNLIDSTRAGIVKSIHWLLVLWLVRTPTPHASSYSLTSQANHVPWEIAPTMWAWAAAVDSTSNSKSSTLCDLLQLLSQLAVALLSLYQIVALLPKSIRGRYLLVAFAIWPMLSLENYIPLSNMVLLSSEDVGNIHRQALNMTRPGPTFRHPIEQLHINARDHLTALIGRQSQSIEAAETEYRQRYGRPPPPGFSRWFAYAKSKQSILIDDFDMINEDLTPFWNITAKQLREGVNQATSIENRALRSCGFSNGVFQGSENDWIVDDFGNLLLDVSKDLPEVSFAVNVVDEPRVAITQQMLGSGNVAKPEFQDLSHNSIWARITDSCQNAVPKAARHEVHDYGLPFVQDWLDARDVCQHSEFKHMHGFFSSPSTALLTDAPIPVLSQAVPTSFGDIVYPSPWYTDKADQGEYQDDLDPPWDNKTDTLYWAGSTTGSHSTNGSWRYSHRQRFIELVTYHNETLHKYMKKIKSGAWGSYRDIEDSSDQFDVKFTAVIQCDEYDCEEQRQYFTLGEREEGYQQHASKFVFDIDGNSFSGRYYTLLRSRSVVLKQTVFREWHDERLIPWVHFVPVSLSMEELPEIMRYLTHDETGRRIAKNIADAGREWHARVLRREDFTIYLYRLMLELARIMDPSRLPGNETA